MAKHYAVAIGLTVPVEPYVGINGQRWPTIEEVAELVLPLWAEKNKAHNAKVEAVREARQVLQAAGMAAEAERIAFPKWEEPAWRVEPRPASGNYTIDPFAGWWVN